MDVHLAIYLCLNCSALYKEASSHITIKCITADPWTKDQLAFLQHGGNRKMREFLSNYEMQEFIYRQRLRTKAVEYYRTMVRILALSSRRNPAAGWPPWPQMPSPAWSPPPTRRLSGRCLQNR